MDRWKFYIKEKVIGKGSFGSAHLVKCTVNERLYVIKSIELPSNVSNEKDKSRCLDEIKILQACKHINVIRYKECFLEPASVNNPGLMINIVMEYADAGDLGYHIKRQKEEVKTFFLEKEVRNWLVQLTLALRYLHTKVRVLHRDIKTQNIFMTSNNLLKLGDFGVSKILSPGNDFALTQIGTPLNVCPEMVSGQPYDFKSDIWGLGCVTYEMCSQKHAFQAASIEEIMKNIKAARYPPIPSMYSKNLSDLIRVMLKVDPKSRPTAYQLATCEALAEDLQHQLDFVKKLPVGSSSSGASSDSAGGATRNSCASVISGEATTSSGVYSGEIRPQD